MLRSGAIFGTLVIAGVLAFVLCGEGDVPPLATGDDGPATTEETAAPLRVGVRTLMVEFPIHVPPPSSAGALLVDPRVADPANLKSWAMNAHLDRATRYAALRRLEERGDDPALVSLAEFLLDDPDRLIQRNALAVLARSQSPRARNIVANLDPQSRRIAKLLAGRRENAR